MADPPDATDDIVLALVGALVLCGCACACRYIPRWSGAARVVASLVIL